MAMVQQSSEDRSSITALLVEDNPGDAVLIAAMLDRTDDPRWRIHHVPSLAEALACLNHQAFDVCLLDLSLGDSQGLEGIRRVRQACPAVPVVVLTGLDDRAMGVEALRAGAQDYLVKGRTDGHLLARSVRYAIERAAAEGQRQRLMDQLQAARDELENRVLERTAELNAANRALQLHIECDKAMIRQSSERELLQDICQIIANIGGYHLAWVGMPDKDGSAAVTPVASSGCIDECLQTIQRTWGTDSAQASPAAQTIRTCRPVVIRDIPAGAAAADPAAVADGRRSRSCVALPLTSQGEALGTLSICSLRPDSFQDAEIRLLGELSDDLAFGIVALRTHEQQQRADEALHRLERDVLRIGQAERQRIGHDLHDTLGQNLTGVAIMAEALARKLRGRSIPEAADAAAMAKHINQSIILARNLAHGLCPVQFKAGGLMTALEEYAANASSLFGVSCRFQCDRPVVVGDDTVAVHVYQIAQEATSNAVRHGQARCVTIALDGDSDRATLTVQDNGVGMPPELDENKGMGLRIMRYRAHVIGANLAIRPANGRGTIVSCVFPLH